MEAGMLACLGERGSRGQIWRGICFFLGFPEMQHMLPNLSGDSSGTCLSGEAGGNHWKRGYGG